MTPRNPLDGKVIIDRTLAKAVLDILDANCASFSAHEREELRHALAQDLTGWAAAPVVSTGAMDKAGYEKALSNNNNEETLPYSDFEEVFSAMLAASPPLPNTKEDV